MRLGPAESGPLNCQVDPEDIDLRWDEDEDQEQAHEVESEEARLAGVAAGQYGCEGEAVAVESDDNEDC